MTGLGEIFLLLFIYAVHRIILEIGIEIPASVVCMLILFIGLLLMEQLIGTKKVSRIVRILEGNEINTDQSPPPHYVDNGNNDNNKSLEKSTIEKISNTLKKAFHIRDGVSTKRIKFYGPIGFSLRWINVFFTPAFILLPLSERVTIFEALSIAAVFVIGYLVTMAFTVYMVLGLQKIIGKPRRSFVEDLAIQSPNSFSQQDINLTEINNNNTTGARDSVEKVSLPDVQSVNELPPSSSSQPTHSISRAYPAPSLEGPAHAHGDIDQVSGRRSSVGSDVSAQSTLDENGDLGLSTPSQHDNNNNLSTVSTNNLNPELSTANGGTTTTVPINPISTHEEIHKYQLRNSVSRFVHRKIDWILYTLFLIAGLFVYLFSATSYAMPLHLSLVVLTFLLAMQIPHKYRIYLHPILVCSALTIFGIYITSILYTASIPYSSTEINKSIESAESSSGFHTKFRKSFAFPALQQALLQFKTGRNYLNVFDKGHWQDASLQIYNPKKLAFEPVLPGAGDVISTLLDTSIVALAVPMYNYRRDLKQNVSCYFYFYLLHTFLLLTLFSFLSLLFLASLPALFPFSHTHPSVTMSGLPTRVHFRFLHAA